MNTELELFVAMAGKVKLLEREHALIMEELIIGYIRLLTQKQWKNAELKQ